jgi:integrase
MTSIFKRKGRPGWTLKYEDAGGRVRYRQFKTREAAKDEDHRLRGVPAPGRAATLAEYAERWLKQIGPSLRPGSLNVYTRDVRRHIIPGLGHRQLRELTPIDVKDLLASKRTTLAKKTVLNIKTTLHACLAEAVADGYLASNPASLRGRSRAMKLQPTRAERAAKIMAMDSGQLGAFLAAAREHRPDWWPVFRVMAITGMRPGEALALQWEDFDLAGRTVLVRRGWTGGRVMPTKSGAERPVDAIGGPRRLEHARCRDRAPARRAGLPVAPPRTHRGPAIAPSPRARVQGGAEAGRPARPLHPALAPPQLRVDPARARRLDLLRAAPARARVHPDDGRPLRPLAAGHEPGRRRRPRGGAGRRKVTSKSPTCPAPCRQWR